ncbi:hypothetical protein [Streptomyces sp. NPDC006134]|uniref:hypothetical protein n=1 Tax=Streptomyces sp. NPDC006134 TaxID=3154467 RepID=UPI0033D4AE5B
MTKAARDGLLGLISSPQRGGRTAVPVVTLGPYTYIPAPAHSSRTVNGTLTRGGLPVTLQVTEPILRHFLKVMTELESELARRWVEDQGESGLSPAE